MEILTTSIISFFLFYFYRKIIIYKTNFAEIPSGAGSLFVIFVLLIPIKSNYENFSIYIISFLTLVYLIDDLIKLNFKIRVLIQLFSGFFIIYLNLNFSDINYFVLFIFMGMLFSFTFTNLFNFNDGANLHVSFLFSIILSSLYYFGDISQNFVDSFILTSLVFIFIFMIFNHFNLLFFGDSGCFLFSNLILLILLLSQSTYNLYLFFSVISFHIIDAIYVFMLRLKNHENLLTRNFHHLYQKLEIRFKNYVYLVPNLFSYIFSIILFIYFPNLLGLLFIYTFNLFVYVIIRKTLVSN